jgi:hypothetical protein
MILTVALELRYDAVRYNPVYNRFQPLQILASSLRNDQSAVVAMSVDEARDLHRSLGVLLDNLGDTHE